MYKGFPEALVASKAPQHYPCRVHNSS